MAWESLRLVQGSNPMLLFTVWDNTAYTMRFYYLFGHFMPFLESDPPTNLLFRRGVICARNFQDIGKNPRQKEPASMYVYPWLAFVDEAAN